MALHELDDRSVKILLHLIESYIQEGQPVGSKWLSENTSVNLSPASIRAIMSDLEEAGFLCSPHTSAGRIPTALGYRFFANRILSAELPSLVSSDELFGAFARHTDKPMLIEQASAVLSKLTQLAGVVTLPKREQLVLRQVEFLPLSSKKVLVILISDNYDVQNRVIETHREFSRQELEAAGNYLTTCFCGKDLLAARSELLERMKSERFDLESMLKTVIDMAEHIETETSEYVLSGEANLFDNALNFEDYHQLGALFKAFSQKRDILHLLDRSLNARGIQVFIGKESGHDALQDYSLVTAPYSIQGNVVGVLGVIGPTRMPYHRVISAVDMTSKLLSRSYS